MDVVVVCLGQCGTALGAQFLVELEGVLPLATHERRARFVFVDAEPKALDAAGVRGVATGGVSAPLGAAAVWAQSGCGNNWAQGYAGLAERGLLARAMDAVRAATEACAMLEGFIFVRSLGGGTGGGLGSRLLEAVREGYGRRVWLVDVLVGAFDAGEAPLAGLNTALALNASLQTADALCWRSNSELAAVVAGTRERFELHDLNVYLSRAMVGLFAPLADAAPRRLGDLTAALCPLACVKIFELRAAPWVTRRTASVARAPRWGAVLAATISQFPAHAPARALAHVAIARGATSGDDAVDLGKLTAALATVAPPVAWARHSVDLAHCAAPPLARDTRIGRTLTLATNGNGAVAKLRAVVDRAAVLFEAGAYLHWFARHGCDEADIADALLELQAAGDAYEHYCA